MTPEQIDKINALAATEIMEWFDNPIFPSLYWWETASVRTSKADWQPYSVREQAETLLGRLPVVTVFYGGNEEGEIVCYLLVSGGEGATRGTRTVTGRGVTEAAALTMACLRAAGADMPEFQDGRVPEMPWPGCVLDKPLIYQNQKDGEA